jgi:uncharacterized protein (DUF885 family)
MDRRGREAGAFLARFDAVDTTRLTATERVTRAVLRRALAEQVEGNRFGQRAVLFTTYYGWHTGFADLPDRHPFRGRDDYAAYVARLLAFPAYNRGAIATTRAALAGGFAQPCEPLAGYERTIAGSVADDPERSRFLEPFARRRPGIADADWAALRSRAVAAVRDSVAPAYRALLAFYGAEYAPRCRPTAGVAATPDGAAYYAFRVRRETTTDLTPAQVHALGLAEVARVGRLMDSVAAAAGSADRRAYVARLRTDPRYYARSADELLAAAATVAKRLDGEMPRLFGRLPRLPYTVRPVPAAVAEGTTTAYYGPGSLEGGRPGVYWVNTSRLDQRPLYELPALTMHEAVPGHHQQIALAQELDLPPFRRHGASFAAFTEGWGLYSERLGLEFGLYDTPEKEMGRPELRDVARLPARGRHGHPRLRVDARAGRRLHAHAHGALAGQRRGGGEPLRHLARTGHRVQGGRAAHPRRARARRAAARRTLRPPGVPRRGARARAGAARRDGSARGRVDRRRGAAAVSGRSRLAAMLTDPHLWPPVVVLLAGLVVLAWVHG